MAFDLAATMDAIAATLVTAGLTDKAYAYLPATVDPPCVVVGYPVRGGIEFDLTAKDGGTKATFTVDFLVGAVSGIEARNALSTTVHGVGSVKTALESLTSGLAAVVQTVRVRDCGIEVFKMPAPDTSEYLAARYDVEVIA